MAPRNAIRNISATLVLLLSCLPVKAEVPSAESVGIASRPCTRIGQNRAQTEARTLVAELRKELKPIQEKIMEGQFLREMEAGKATRAQLAALVAEQYRIAISDQLSFQRMAERWSGNDPKSKMSLFAVLASSEERTLQQLVEFATRINQSRTALESYEPRAESQIYPARVASLAVTAGRAASATAVLVNFPVYRAAMDRIRQALIAKYGFSKDEIEYFIQASAPLKTNFELAALEQIGKGLQEGECVQDIRTNVRLLQEAELSFWQAAADAPVSQWNP